MRKLGILMGIAVTVSCAGRSISDDVSSSGGSSSSGSSSGGTIGDDEPRGSGGQTGSAGRSSGLGGSPGGASAGGSSGRPSVGGAGGFASGGTSSAGEGGGDGTDGTAGDDGGTGECAFPEVDVELPTWMDSEVTDFDENYERISAGMVGTWQGVVTTPQWVPPYEVRVRFDADGRYSASCVWKSNLCCIAFYYGTDDDTDIKRYGLTAISNDGAQGFIDIAFDYGDSYDLPGWQGVLRNVDLDATGDRLRLDFWTDDNYGPVTFDLARSGAE